jgi:hypothetical protein
MLKKPQNDFMRQSIGRLGLMVAAVLLVSLVAFAQEKSTPAKSDIIKIKLKDFKFKPPKGVSDPDSVFIYNEDEEKLSYYTNGPAEAKFKLPADGEWDLIISASGDSAKDEHPKFLLTIDEKGFSKETTLKSDDVKDYKFTIPLKAGEHVLSIAFTNDTYKEGEYDSNLYVHGAKLMPHKPDEAKK